MHVHNDPIMTQRLLLTLFFINNNPIQTPQLSPFLVEMAVCEFFIAALHHYSCLCNNGITLFWSISLNVLLSSARVRIKLSSTYSKARRTCFLISSCSHQQPLHCLIHTFRSNYDEYYHSFSARTIDLHVDATRISSCCVSSLVILVVPVDLCILCVRSSECKQVMSCIGVG